MGLKIGSGSSNVKTITFKNRDGTVAGTMSVTKPVKKKPKRVKYNFKELSVQIMGAKTSGNARMVTSKAQSRVAMLRQQLKNDDYDSAELKSALAHAMKMEQVARKRAKHLQQEEKIKQQGGGSCIEIEEMEKNPELDESIGEEKELKLKEQELKKLVREYEKFMRESVEKTTKNLDDALESNDLLSEITEAVPEDMSPEDLELLKKKHRAKEMKEIMEADLQYLKAMFDRLAKEKQDIGSGAVGSDIGVAAEFGGMEMPVQMMEAPAPTQGASLDITV